MYGYVDKKIFFHRAWMLLVSPPFSGGGTDSFLNLSHYRDSIVHFYGIVPLAASNMTTYLIKASSNFAHTCGTSTTTISSKSALEKYLPPLFPDPLRIKPQECSSKVDLFEVR